MWALAVAQCRHMSLVSSKCRGWAARVRMGGEWGCGDLGWKHFGCVELPPGVRHHLQRAAPTEAQEGADSEVRSRWVRGRAWLMS